MVVCPTAPLGAGGGAFSLCFEVSLCTTASFLSGSSGPHLLLKLQGDWFPAGFGEEDCEANPGTTYPEALLNGVIVRVSEDEVLASVPVDEELPEIEGGTAACLWFACAMMMARCALAHARLFLKAVNPFPRDRGSSSREYTPTLLV